MTADLKARILESLKKAKTHLQYSFEKASRIPLTPSLSEDKLETLESFSSRFSRFSDLIISRYFRVLVSENDPAFRGSTIDVLNQAEKFGWIESAMEWKRIRELRNIAAHEYEAEDYNALYAELMRLTPALLRVKF